MRNTWTALAALCACQLMVVLDGSIVAVALPLIGRDFHTTGPLLAWVVNAYLVPFGGLLLLAGRLGDLLGSRKMLLLGLIVFTAASVACALAPSLGVLAAARFVQGVGAAMASAVVLGMIVTLFPTSSDRGRALAVYGFVGAAGSSVGLLAGGVLTQVLNWRWIFLINVPLGIGAVLAIRLTVPTVRPGGRRPDVAGAVLATAGLTLAVYALLATNLDGTAELLLGFAVLILLAAFLVRQARVVNPILPLRLLLNSSTGVGNLVQALMVAGLFGFQFLGVQYLQRLLGYNPFRAGLAFLPVPVLIAVVSLGFSARLISRLGLRRVLLIGLVFVVVGLGLLVRLSASGDYVGELLPAGLAIAVGFGLAFPALAALAVGGAEPADAGVASGLFNTTQQIGGAIGLALLSRIVDANNTAHRTAMTQLAGYHHAFATAAALAATALLIAGACRAPSQIAQTDAPTAQAQPRSSTDNSETGATLKQGRVAPAVVRRGAGAADV